MPLPLLQDGYTLMHYARSGAAVRLLVRQGAFVNAKAEVGDTREGLRRMGVWKHSTCT